MKKGSYTVEAALLMGLIIPLLTGLIGTGIFLELRAKAYAEALEQACIAALNGEAYENAVITGEQITASVSKTVPKLPMAGMFFDEKEQVEGNCTLEQKNPTETIFRLHSLKRVIRQVIE